MPSSIYSEGAIEIAFIIIIIIKFQSARNEHGLFQIGGFPCPIVCVNGTHTRIKGPSLREPDFVNRIGFHSTNVQA